jgi:Tol biopolymer transport system component
MNLMRMGLLWLSGLSFVLLIGCGYPERSFNPGPPIAATVDLWPKWSPADSAKIAYTHLAETIEETQLYGDVSVWIANTVTGTKRFVSIGSACDWSPDGRQIVLAWGGIWIIDLESGTKRNLTCENGSCSHIWADVSPSGTEIAYVQDSPRRGTWILDTLSISTKWISPFYGPDWAPTGTEILCDGLVVIGTDGTRLRSIPHDALPIAVHARWSPDGSHIALGGEDKNGIGGVWTMKADGSEVRHVSNGATPSWSPDGKRIAYGAVSADGKISAIWVVNVDGTGRTQITFSNPRGADAIR